MKYAVISYWIGEPENLALWLYNSEEEAKTALSRLWQKSFEAAEEDEDFDEENSYFDDDIAVIAWKDHLYRYFEVVRQNTTEDIV